MQPPSSEPADESDDPIAELIRRARVGDRSALDQLVAFWSPQLAEWTTRQARDGRVGTQRPSDIAQESALRAFAKFQTFSGTSSAELEAWLRRIVANQIVQAHRDAQRHKRDDRKTIPLDALTDKDQDSRQPSPSHTVAQDQEWQRVLACLFELPDAQREAIWLCHLREQPVSRVAKQMKRTEGSVAGLIHRGLKIVHQRMTGATDRGSISEPIDPAQEAAVAGLLEYLRHRDSETAVDVDAIIARHPVCADELRTMLVWVQRIQTIRPHAPK